MCRRPRIFIKESADLLGHAQPGPSLGAVDGNELERRGLAAHDSGDGGVALLGPVDAGAVPRPGGIRPGPIDGWTRLAAPDLFEIARRDVRAARGITHPLHRGRVDGASFGRGLLELILGRPHGAARAVGAQAAPQGLAASIRGSCSLGHRIIPPAGARAGVSSLGHLAGWPVGARRVTSVYVFKQSGEA